MLSSVPARASYGSSFFAPGSLYTAFFRHRGIFFAGEDGRIVKWLVRVEKRRRAGEEAPLPPTERTLHRQGSLGRMETSPLSRTRAGELSNVPGHGTTCAACRTTTGSTLSWYAGASATSCSYR